MIDLPYRQVLWENLLPHYLSIGVSEDKFWDSCPKELEPYDLANNISIERQNRLNWVHGMYVASAIGCCFSKECQYPEEPIRMTELTEYEQQEKVRKAREDVIAFFSAMIPKEGDTK